MANQKTIDSYIESAAEFARPILKHLRQQVHNNCPTVEESIKWSFPNFVYKGSILCSMAAFKQHCSFGFWLSKLMKDSENILETSEGKSAMGHLGQIKSLADLPTDEVLATYIQEAMHLTDIGAKLPKNVPDKTSRALEIPDYFTEALKNDAAASLVFEKFSYSAKKDYVEWLTEAKTEATRNKRLATAIEWISEGKMRHWKYQG